jgi:phosphoglycerate dehydrogenase-like enzyme
MLKIAILDDYLNLALQCADWDRLKGVADITVFDRHLTEAEAAEVLQPFDVLCTMRERMALPRTLLERLPALKLILIVGAQLAVLDMDAATARGVTVCHSDVEGAPYRSVTYAAPELAWGLVIAAARGIAHEHEGMRRGRWQSGAGTLLAGQTLGLLGLGRIGRRLARYARAFDMPVIAWSQNLTDEAAAAEGAVRVDKDDLFARADVLSIQVRLSERTRGLVSARELALMKPAAFLVNTARGPIVDEAALVSALRARRIAGAALDVFDVEPLPVGHPLRSLDNVTLTPHQGYATRQSLEAYYGDMPEAIAAFAAGRPIRVANPQVRPRA